MQTVLAEDPATQAPQPPQRRRFSFRFLRLKKLHVLVLRAFIEPFLAGFSVSVFVLVLQELLKRRNALFGKGLPFSFILEIMAYASISLVVISMILGVLLASLMTLGKLGENYELAALKASGISLWRTVRPLMGFVAGVTVLCMVWSSYAEPWAKLRMYRRFYDAEQARPEFSLRPGLFNNIIPGYTMRISSRKPDGSMLYGMRIYDHTNPTPGGTVIIVSDSARMSRNDSLIYLNLEMYHGTRYEEEPRRPGALNETPPPFNRIAFDTLQYNIDLSAFFKEDTPDSAFATHQYMRRLPQLVRDVDSLQKMPAITRSQLNTYFDPQLGLGRRLGIDTVATLATVQPSKSLFDYDTLKVRTRVNAVNTALNSARSVRQGIGNLETRAEEQERRMRGYQLELHAKFALPVAVFLFLFIGAPMGAIIRKGGIGAPIVVAICFFVLYYVLMSYGRKSAAEGLLPVWVGAWLPVIVITPMALYLSVQSATDSALFDISAWRQGIVRLVNRARK